MKNLTKFLVLSSLILLGTGQMWAWTLKANCVYLDNYGANWTPWMHIYTGSEDQYYALKKVDGTDYYVREYDFGSYSGFDLYNASNTGQRTSWQTESFESPICFSLSGSSWIKKAVGVKDVKLSDNGSTTYGGNGTSSTPYIIWPGDDIKATMSCTKIAETNHTRQYKFNSGSFSSIDTYQEITSTTSGTAYTISGKARAVLTNNTSTTSREFSATSLYYKTATFYLMQPNGQDKGSSVGTMTRDGSGNYTYNWTCSTPGTYKFYVTTNTSSSAYENCDFLHSNSSFSDGTPIQLYLYGNTSAAANKYGDAITLTTTYAGTYIFTFYKDNNNNYQFKCDYPAAYSGLSAVRTPEAAADAPQISNTIVAQGSSVTVTAKTPNTGYKFDGWTSGNGTFGTASDLQTTFTPNANNAVATANYSLINYTITYDPEPPVNFAYTTAPTSKTYGQSVDMTFTPATNYVIASVTAYKTGDEGTTVDVTRDGETNNYSFTQPAYNVTVHVEASLSSVQVTYGKSGNGTIVGKVGGTDIGASPASVDGGATVVFTATPDANYTVEGWYSNSTCTGDELQQGDNTGNPQTYTILNIAEARTVYVKFQETKHAVTINKGTGISSVTPSGSQQVGNVNPVGISAEVATGYTWSQWTSSNVNVTIANPSQSSTTITATGTGTVTATATEILLPLTTSVTESYMGSVDKTASSIGVVTSSQLTASSANRNYKFKQWHLTNCTITSGTINDATITIKGDGVNNPSAEAEFEVAWLISGNQDISTGWGASGTKMTVVSDGVFKFEFNATKVASNDGDYNFKVYNTVRSAYYANTAGDGGWWFTRGANSTTLAEGAQSSTNMSLRSDMVGNYIFTLDCSTSRANPTLTVTFPTTTTYDVDIYYDGVTKTTVEGGAFAKQITAQVPESMTFDHWEVEGETTHVNITDVNSQTTTFTASGEGAIIRAKFNTNKRIYLKGGSNFANAYLNFYKDAYWNSDFGSGNTGSECVQRNQQMTKIKNTDIFWYDLNNASNQWNNYFTFVNKSGDYNNFSMCNVVYRNDMKDALPFYVPRNSYANEHHNTSQYFNEGIWMKYNSTESGYDLRGNWNWEDKSYRFIAETPGGYEFKTTIHLTAGTTYEFKIYNDNGTNYGATNQTMTATSCTNWKMHLNNGNCKITASDEGDYTFTLNLGSGEVIISVQYPLSASDYQVVAKQGGIVKWEGDLIKHSNEAKKDTTSFFNNNYTFQLQQYNGTSWSDIAGQMVTPAAEGSQGVIDFIVTQDGNGNATLAYKGIYTGNYYIRTDGVDGGWGDYKNNSDNKMENYGSSIDADPDYQYDVYKAKWILSGKNVKFRIANDYSKAISDELRGDDIIGNDKETLPEGANVRFMWNSTTNQLKRAYLSGSTNISDRFLVLEGDAKMFDKDGDPLTTDGGGKIPGLDDYELNFDDKNNWVYQADIKAQPGCAVKLTAKYNGNIQYFIGKEGDGADSRRTIIAGDESDTPYSLRAVYDFKTNRLVAGWIPSGTIENNIELGSDMLIERVGQDDASQIVFGGAEPSSLSISEIQHIYGVLKLRKATMVGATETDYAKCIYWISFPFDVKVSEIFGVEKYGEVWAISNYRGDLRAQKGWFKQDTKTFWEFLKPSDIMKANVGYTLNLDPDYFNKESSEPWKNSATEVAWYFPSIEENIGVVSLAQKDTTLQPMHCTIDREFETDDERTLNHKFTDSNWRVIGVPAFQNLQAPTMTPTEGVDDKVFGLTGFYEWDYEHNTYTAQSTDGYPFHATHSYMVQYEGTIRWSNAAVITTNKAPWHAPEYTYADAKNYSIKLEFGNDDYTDQTFVTLIEKASTDFVLNEDMMKIDNAGFPNIYSFAGAYDVAYNETTFDNQTVLLGVSAPKDGSYTFAMPKDFSGKAVLVDLESGEATDLNLSNYTVELNKGTYNNRFQLLLEVEAKAPTAIDNAKGEWSVDGKTKKLFINSNIYLINAGRIYNVLGVGE